MATRKKIITASSATRLTNTRVPFTDANGDLVDDADMTFATDTLTVKGLIVGTVKVSNYNGQATEGAGVPYNLDTVALTGQTANIASTNFTNSSTAGTYRVSYYLVDTTADVTAGTLTVTIGWNDGTAARTFTSTAIALTATNYTSDSIYLRLGSGSISYLTTVTGIYGTSVYSLYMDLERIS